MRLINSENIVGSLLLEGLRSGRVWRIQKGEFIVNVERCAGLGLSLRMRLSVLLLLLLLLLFVASGKGIRRRGAIGLGEERAGGIDGVRIKSVWSGNSLVLRLRVRLSS